MSQVEFWTAFAGIIGTLWLMGYAIENAIGSNARLILNKFDDLDHRLGRLEDQLAEIGMHASDIAMNTPKLPSDWDDTPPR